MDPIDSILSPSTYRPSEESPEGRATPADDVTALDAIAALLRRRHLIVWLPIVGAVLVAGVTLLLPKKYSTRFSFTPAASTIPPGSLAGLAGQLGVSIGTDPASTPDFYVDLLTTREILEPLVGKRYRVIRGGETVDATVIELYELDQADSGKTIAAAIEAMRTDIVTTSIDRRSSVVTVDVRTKWPDLSYALGSDLLQLIDEFMFRSRQRQGGAERRFLRDRLDTAQAELLTAEKALESFYAQNRSFENDPALKFEHDRLRRHATLRAEVFSTLTQGYEQARVAAVRNTPSVAIVEAPKAPLRADRRYVVAKVAIGLFLGLALAIACIVTIELLARSRAASPAQFAEVRRLWRAAVTEARTLFLRRASE